MSRATRVRSLLAALTMVACGTPADERLQCTVDEDCAGALTCAFNLCALATPNDLVVDVALTPPSSSPLVTQHLTAIRLDESPFRVTLVEPVVLRGDVVKASNRARVNGTITARTPGDIAGTGFLFDGKSSGDGYQIALLPQREYLVSFRPDNNAVPPHTFTWSPDETAADGNYDIVLPDDQYTVISGVVAWGEGLGAEGATVTAYALTGVRLTQTHTESWRGYFTMHLPPGTPSVSLRVQAPATGLQFPSVSTVVEVSKSLIVAVKPPRDPLPVEVLVTSTVEDEATPQQPLSNVALTFVLNDTQGLETASATTDATGVASLDLLPGSYTVEIVPDAQSRYAATSWEMTVTDTDSDAPQLASTTLIPRAAVNGMIRDQAEQTVDGKVLFRRHSKDGYPDGLSSTKVDALMGQFVVNLDPGMYDVTFLPAPQTQAPPFTWRDVAVVSDMPDYSLKLPAPGVFAMQVVDVRGDPVANCQVQVLKSETNGELSYGSDYTDPAGVVVLPVPHTQSTATPPY